MQHDLEDLPLDAGLALRHARNRLRDEFAGDVGEESVDAVLRASWVHIDAGARIKHHVPLLAERLIQGGVTVSVITNGLVITKAVIDDLHVLIPFRLHCYMHAYLKRCSKNSSSRAVAVLC